MYRRGGHFFYAAVLPAWGWVLIAVVGMALLVVVGALVIRRRRAEEAGRKDLSESQRRTLEEFESQVRALLSQHGGRLSQLEIASALGLPAEPIAGKLLKMGGEGLIEREWTVDEYTYSVKRQSA